MNQEFQFISHSHGGNENELAVPSSTCLNESKSCSCSSSKSNSALAMGLSQESSRLGNGLMTWETLTKNKVNGTFHKKYPPHSPFE